MRDGMHVASTTGLQVTPMLSTCASGTTGTPPIDRLQMVFYDGFHATAPLSHSAPGQTLPALPPLHLFRSWGVWRPRIQFCEGIQPKPRARMRYRTSQEVMEGERKAVEGDGENEEGQGHRTEMRSEGR
jgi:hypothetical protein